MRYKILITLICLACGTLTARAGSTAFDFLRLDNGAREVGIGGAAVAAGDATQGVFYNPALIGGITRDNEVSFYHSTWLEGISYQNLAYSMRVPNKTYYFGFRFQNLSYGTLSGYDSIGGKTSDYKAGSDLLGFTYGKALPRRIHAGVTLKEAWEKIGGASANALMVDAGLTMRTNWYQAVWGAALRNFGQKVKYDRDSESVPTVLAVGGAVSPWGEVVRISADTELARDHGAGLKLGIEGNYNRFLYGRCGWDSFVNAGAGIRFGFGIAYKDFIFDYAFFPMSDLGATHHFGIRWAFKGPKAKLGPVIIGSAPAAPEARPLVAEQGGVSDYMSF